MLLKRLLYNLIDTCAVDLSLSRPPSPLFFSFQFNVCALSSDRKSEINIGEILFVLILESVMLGSMCAKAHSLGVQKWLQKFLIKILVVAGCLVLVDRLEKFLKKIHV